MVDYLRRNALLRQTTPLIVFAAGVAALKIPPDAHTATAVNRLKVAEEARVKVAEKLKVAEGFFVA